ncbi:MAG: hypothetical protein WCC94_10045 [Candidatus Bathyarchaeia archaeon]
METVIQQEQAMYGRYGGCESCKEELVLAIGYALQQKLPSIQHVLCVNAACKRVGWILPAPWMYGYCLLCHNPLEPNIDGNMPDVQEVVCRTVGCANEGSVAQSNIDEDPGETEYGRKPTCSFTHERVGSAPTTMREVLHGIRQAAHGGSFDLTDREERRELTENERVLNAIVKSSVRGQEHPNAIIARDELWRHNDRVLHLGKDRLNLLVAHCEKILRRMEVRPRKDIVTALDALLIDLRLQPIGAYPAAGEAVSPGSSKQPPQPPSGVK